MVDSNCPAELRQYLPDVSAAVCGWWTRTARRNCGISYQISLLLSADYPLGLVERIILILELRDELRGQGILTENFLAGGRSRTSEA
jgi:hypothetical protein